MFGAVKSYTVAFLISGRSRDSILKAQSGEHEVGCIQGCSIPDRKNREAGLNLSFDFYFDLNISD